MKVRFIRVLLLMLVLVGISHQATAQNAVTSSDIQRLQDNIFDANRDIAQMRTRDGATASRLQADLDDAREETIYLKVKLRKSEPVARSEYQGLRDRIEDIRLRARGDETARATPIRQSEETRGRAIPAGTEFDVRLKQALSSSTAEVEAQFDATTVVDLRQGERVLVPEGSLMHGVVRDVQKAGRIERKGSLKLDFDRITINGRVYPITASVTNVLESEGYKGDAGKIGVGAGVGAIIGGILGGVKGAAVGILIGGGGVVAATEGKDVDLPAGTILRVRLDTELNPR